LKSRKKFLKTDKSIIMKNGTKFGLGFGLGVIAGGFAGYYLTSEDGKKMRKKASKEFKKFEKNSRKVLQEKSDEISENFQGFIERAEGQIKTAVSKFDDIRESTAEKAKKGITASEEMASKGAKKAQEKIEKSAQKAREALD